MDKMIIKFLDEYLGLEANCTFERGSRGEERFFVWSKRNGELIIIFLRFASYRSNTVVSSSIRKTLGSLFSISGENAETKIKNWLELRFSVKSIEDLPKFE